MEDTESLGSKVEHLCDQFKSPKEDWIFLSVDVQKHKLSFYGSTFGTSYMEQNTSLLSSFYEYCKGKYCEEIQTNESSTSHRNADSSCHLLSGEKDKSVIKEDVETWKPCFFVYNIKEEILSEDECDVSNSNLNKDFDENFIDQRNEKHIQFDDSEKEEINSRSDSDTESYDTVELDVSDNIAILRSGFSHENKSELVSSCCEGENRDSEKFITSDEIDGACIMGKTEETVELDVSDNITILRSGFSHENKSELVSSFCEGENRDSEKFIIKEEVESEDECDISSSHQEKEEINSRSDSDTESYDTVELDVNDNIANLRSGFSHENKSELVSSCCEGENRDSEKFITSDKIDGACIMGKTEETVELDVSDNITILRSGFSHENKSELVSSCCEGENRDSEKFITSDEIDGACIMGKTEETVGDNSKTISPTTLYNCEVCNKKFLSLKGWKLHTEEHLRQMQASSVVDSNSNTSTLSNENEALLKCPILSKMLRCHVCCRIYSKKENLQKHLQIVHKKKQNVTEALGKKLTIKDSSKNNVVVGKKLGKKSNNIRTPAIIFGHKDYKCQVCQKVFTNLGLLKIHLRRMHSSSLSKEWLKKVEGDSSIKPYKVYGFKDYRCLYCNKSYCNFGLLKIHLKRMHLYIVPEEQLKRKLKLNHKPKSDTRNLKSIKSTCTGGKYTNIKAKAVSNGEKVKKIQCIECLSSFHNVGNLKRHLKNVHKKDPQKYREHMQNKLQDSIAEKGIESGGITSSLILGKKTKIEYKCTQCSRVFYKKTWLMKHEQTHLYMKSCEYCHKKFPSRIHLNYHLRTHGISTKLNKENGKREKIHVNDLNTDISKEQKPAVDIKKNINRCNMCKVVFSSSENLNRHFRIFPHRETIFKCKTCGKQFPSSKNLREHEHVHLEKRFVCDVCGKKFASRRYLTEHKHVHVEKTFACQVCDARFSLKKRLRFHSRHFHPNVHHKCETCKEKFLIDIDLKEHIACKHPDLKVNEKPTCKTCGKKFSSVKNLKDHEPLHLEKKFACEACDERYSMRKPLRMHCKKHHPNILHECKGCEEKFHTGFDLKEHIRCKHANKKLEENTTCMTCGKQFSSKKQLREHVYIHLEKKFACDLCDKKYSLKKMLRSHSKKHHPDVHHECETCKEKFFIAIDLKVHILQQHTDRNVKGKTSSGPHGKKESNDLCQTLLDLKKKSVLKTPKQRGASGIQNTEKLVNRYEGSKTSVSVILTDCVKKAVESNSNDKNEKYSCRKCMKCFANKSNLMRHLETPKHLKHGRTHLETPKHLKRGSPSERPKHLKSERPSERPHVCFLCQKSYKKNYHLEEHMRLHTGEVPYSCTACNQRFSRYSELFSHCKHIHKTTVKAMESDTKTDKAIENETTTVGVVGKETKAVKDLENETTTLKVIESDIQTVKAMENEAKIVKAVEKDKDC